MRNAWKTVKVWIVDIGFDVAGCSLFAIGTQVFNAPNNIAPGGATGVATLINHLTGLSISIGSLLINIPLVVLAFLFLGHRFTLRTLKTILILTAMLELADRYVPVYHGEPLLAALYGGILLGIGIALAFMRGTTTGGVDILVRLIQIRRPDFSSGRLMFTLDACVLLSAAFVYRNLESALYALIGIFACSRMLDSLLYGMDVGKVMMIVSQKHEKVTACIHHEMERGCTLLDGRGTYTDTSRPVILCAVRKPQYYELKKLVHQVDPDAFMVALEANEIIGEGFKNLADET